MSECTLLSGKIQGYLTKAERHWANCWCVVKYFDDRISWYSSVDCHEDLRLDLAQVMSPSIVLGINRARPKHQLLSIRMEYWGELRTRKSARLSRSPSVAGERVRATDD